MKSYIIIYIIFLFILGILFLINKRKLKTKLIIIYFIYWHILFLNLALSLTFFNGKENEAGILIQTNIDRYCLAFFIVIFPFFIFYIKNIFLRKYNIKIDIIRNILIDFIKTLLMIIIVLIIYNILTINFIR